jgi:cobalt-zinc-cadmium efflux system outer membrane protein
MELLMIQFYRPWAVYFCIIFLLSAAGCGGRACAAEVEHLNLEDAIRLAIENNPSFQSERHKTEAASHAASMARALSNPSVTVGPTIAGTRGSDAVLTVIQPLEINGQRRVRSRAAAWEEKAQSGSTQAFNRELVCRVKLTYWDIVRAQEILNFSRENLNYLDKFNAAAKKQLKAGIVSGSQVMKTEVELAKARQELFRVEQELSMAKSAMNNLLNRPADYPFTVKGLLLFREIKLDGKLFSRSALNDRPEIAAMEAKFNAARENVKAEKLRQVPDLAVQYRQETSQGDGGIALVISVPVIDLGSIRAGVRKARSLAKSAERDLEAARNGVILQVDQAVRKVNTLAGIVEEFHGGILKNSERLMAMSQKGYENGVLSYLEVLEAQRTLRSVRLEYIQALTDYEKALAELERATGVDPFTAVNGEEKR